MITKTFVQDEARDILARNDRGVWTQPTEGLYPHQWLWDSCFIAIGMAHYDPKRAAQEILSIFRGQWTNGMIPHIIFSGAKKYSYGPEFWESKKYGGSLIEADTSGITQPPMVAIASLEVANRLHEEERKAFLAKAFPRILAYHKWIYEERDPKNTGLCVLFHPWETGLDNTPPWMKVMEKVDHKDCRLKRVDTDFVSKEERPTETEHDQLTSLALFQKSLGYDSKKIIEKSPVLVESLIFNSILAEANRALLKISKYLELDVPKKLFQKFKKTEKGVQMLWDEETGQFYPRDFSSGRLIKISSSSTFMPLYCGAANDSQKQKLFQLLLDRKKYWTQYPVPTTPIDSPYFKERCYWQGPVWTNMNWFIIKGLQKIGYNDEASYLKERTKRMIEEFGFREYYSALDGSGCGGKDFSWTAALAIDLFSDV